MQISKFKTSIVAFYVLFITIAASSSIYANNNYQPGSMALIQYNADLLFGEYQNNLQNLTQHALEAVQKGAKIIVFPEGSTWGYASEKEVWCRPGTSNNHRDLLHAGKTCRDVTQASEQVPQGRTTIYWEKFAKLHQVTIVFHLIEKEGQKYYNGLGVVGPSGYITKYHKRALYWVDKMYASPGMGPTVLTTPYGKFGLMICMDATYDGPLYNEYKRLGTAAIILSMDWDQTVGGPMDAKYFFPQRAKKNGVDIYAADVSFWDGTGKYPSDGGERERFGLADVAIGEEGFSLHNLNY